MTVQLMDTGDSSGPQLAKATGGLMHDGDDGVRMGDRQRRRGGGPQMPKVGGGDRQDG